MIALVTNKIPPPDGKLPEDGDEANARRERERAVAQGIMEVAAMLGLGSCRHGLPAQGTEIDIRDIPVAE